MRRVGLLMFISLVFFAGVSSAQDAKSVVNKVAEAIGAANVKTIQYSGTGFNFTFGQGYRAIDPWPKYALKTYVRVLDFQNDAGEEKSAWTQAEEGERGGGFAPLKGNIAADAFVSGDAAWNVAGPNANPAPAAVEDRQVGLALTPYGWVKAALADSPTVENKKVNGKPMTVVSFMWKGKYKVNGYVDAQNMLTRVETWTPQPILGDMLTEVDYSDYKDFSGVKFPMKILEKQGGYPILDLTVTDVNVNVPVNIQVPPAALTAKVPPIMAVSQPLGSGVWIVRAGGAQSLAVEFKDYSVIVDGYASEPRSLAVIAETKKLIPNKPIKYVVNTHHHLDHSGGLRTFPAEGITIVTAEENKAYFQKIFKLPHTLDPDELAKNPKPATFVGVKDKYVITDGDQSIELYRLVDDNYPDHQNSHAPDMLIAYLPKIKTLYEADFFNPGPPVRPGAPPPPFIGVIGNKEVLLANIQRLKLDVQEFVPTHYGMGELPFSQLQKEIDIEHDQLKQLSSQNIN
jgi:glyoxylase-like metal-dependent hydrolase (beta-lactamase superfamily II)